MTPFQWIAVPVFSVLFVVDTAMLLRGPRRTVALMIRCLVWLLAALAIGRQQWVQYLADMLGIGRGADLVTYVLSLAFVVVTFYLFSRHVRTQTQLTEIVRYLAIMEAKRGGPARHADSSDA